MSDVRKEIEGVMYKVIQLCKENTKLVGDYRSLVLTYWSLGTEEAKNSPESVSRAYRKAIEKGLIEVPKGIKVRNEEREQEFREVIGEV